jgi:xylan 1,4-beta-xylosidase
MAGLMCLYDDQNFYYAFIGIDEEFGRHVCVLESSSSVLKTGPKIGIPSAARRIHLRAEYNVDTLNFFFSLNGDTWKTLASELDATILSDEHATAGLGFTGAFGAICAHDMSGRRIIADFDYFEYKELELARI